MDQLRIQILIVLGAFTYVALVDQVGRLANWLRARRTFPSPAGPGRASKLTPGAIDLAP